MNLEITNTIRQLIMISLGVFLSINGLCQIQGSVINMNNNPVAFANVLLLNANDSSVVSGVMASEHGTFNITSFSPGSYIIGVRMMGYKPVFTESFAILESNVHIHKEPIYVEEVSHQLEDVKVVAKKPIYELKIDRMVVNVENSVTSSGNTALEVLEKSPGVIVDRQNNGISLSGKSGVMVMINGKQNRMPLDAAVQMLDGMSADNVKRIELITTPPAKYDAEGDAGIINIVLKKNDAFGTNGSFTLGAGYGEREKFNGSLNLNHHADKVNYFGLYSASYNNTFQEFNSTRKYKSGDLSKEIVSLSDRNASIIYQNARAGFDYTISSKTVFGMLFSGYIRDWDMDAVSQIDYFTNDVLTAHSDLNTIELNKWYHGMGNINLRHSFEEDEVLDFNFDYLHYNNNNPSYYKLSELDNEGNILSGEEIDVRKETPINIFVGMLDYSKQFNPDFKLEVGLKTTFSYFTNDVGVSYLRSGIWIEDEELTNKYSLDENISAVYTSLSYKLNDKTSIVAGLRYEYLNTVLNSVEEQGIVDLHYGKFFPTVYLSKEINENNTIQFAYNKRITRPTFNELAPFILILTPETFVKGNENLLPAISNGVKMDYQYKTVMFTISYTDTENSISRFQPTFSEDEVQYYSSRNLDTRKNASAILAFPITVSKWWRMQNNFSGVYNRINTDYEEEKLDIKTESFRFNSIQNISLSTAFMLELSGFYQSATSFGVMERRAFGRIDAGLQWKFKNEKSRLDLNFVDIFNTGTMRLKANIPELNIDMNSKIGFETQQLKLTFTHNFGNTSTKSRTRTTASEEERKRITNN